MEYKDLETIKFKHSESLGWYYKIDVATGDRIDFDEKHPFYKEMMSWIDSGNEIEPKHTQEELGLIESENYNLLVSALKSERNRRVLEADKWELPTVMQRYGLTTEQILVYKQVLLDMPQTHITQEQLENPQWPDKLITEELL